MTETRGVLRTHAARWTGEFLVIVVGILAALAVDGWVQAMDDRELEELYLERLVDDLDWDLKEIDESWESASRRVGDMVWLLRELGDPLPDYWNIPLWQGLELDDAPDGKDFGSAVGSLLRDIRSMDHRRTTFEEMIATGGVRVLRNADLRRRIAEYYSLVQTRLDEHRINIEGPELRVNDLVMAHTGFTVADFRNVDDPRTLFTAVPNIGVELRHLMQRTELGAYLVADVVAEAEALRADLLTELQTL